MTTIAELLGRAVNKLRDDSLEQGTLGVHRPDSTVDMQVTGRAGWLHVTLNGQTPVKAFNAANVPQTTDLQVDMRVIDGRRVIVGASRFDNLAVPVPVPPSGVWAHPISEHSDADITAAASGDVLAHDGTNWVDETPVTTSAGAGDAGKLVRLDAGGQIDATMVNDADINLDNVTEGTTNKFFTATDETKLGTIEDNADVTDAANVGSSIHGATAKTTPVDADTMPLIDSAASNVLKKVTWANIKATLVATFLTFTNKIAIAATATSGAALRVIRDLGSGSTDSAVFELIQENAGDDQAAMYVRQDGSGAIAQFYDGATQTVTIADGGNLGIAGATAPDAPLTIRQPFARFSDKVDFLMGHTSQNSVIQIGQDATHNLFYGWHYDAIAANAYADISTFGGNNNIAMQVSGGNLGIGVTSPQGKLHAHDGAGGFMFVTKTGINGTVQTIIPNGTGDVTRRLYIRGVIEDGTGGSATLGGGISAPGSMWLWDDGGTNRVTLTLAANGEVTVQRTAGSRTYSIAVTITWL